jgi:hypothetical protein
MPDGQMITDRAEIVLRQTVGSISAGRLAERVADALHAAQHPHLAKTDPLRVPIAAAVLAIAVLGRRPGKSVLEAVNGAIRVLQPTLQSLPNYAVEKPVSTPLIPHAPKKFQ